MLGKDVWANSCRPPDSGAVSPQDFAFILKGLSRLLNNPLLQTYLPGSTKKVQFNQELLVLFWKLCDVNKVSTPEQGSSTFVS